MGTVIFFVFGGVLAVILLVNINEQLNWVSCCYVEPLWVVGFPVCSPFAILAKSFDWKL